MNKAIHVIRREYIANVRKKSFVIATVLVPVIMASLFFIPVLITFFVPDTQYKVAVLDETEGVGAAFVRALDDTLADGRPRYVATSVTAEGPALAQEKARLRERIQQGTLDILLVIPKSVFEDGKVVYLTRDVRKFQIFDEFETLLTRVVLERRLAQAGLDTSQVSKLTTHVQLDVQQMRRTGQVEEKSFLGEWGVVFIFVMLLYASLLTWGMTISRGILEEKGSRVVEVLLSSIRPRDLLMGKVVGIGLAGLTQLAVWGAFGLILSLYAVAANTSVLSAIRIPPIAFLWLIVYFVLGFLLYASVFTVIGSICNTEQDAQQLQGIVTLPLMLPLVILMVIIESPNGALAMVLSIFPLFAPMLMVARIVLSEPAWWEIALSLVLLVLSIFGAVAFSARVFRVGILMYGKRPNLREVIRWYRQAG